MEIINQIINSRPEADHSLEQYLLTKESLKLQANLLSKYVFGKKTIYIGDDDHFSLIASKNLNSESLVLEIDERVINSQKSIEEKNKISNHSILRYDVIDFPPKNLFNSFDCFIINPPYGSKNGGYGSKVWISRALFCLKPRSLGIIVLPIILKKKWTISNITEIQKFLILNNCTIIDIHKDVHTYLDLPLKDVEMKSSNIVIQYSGHAENLIRIVDRNLYR